MSPISEARESLLEQVRERFSKSQLEELEQAIDVATAAHAHQKRGTGEPYVTHPIAVAKILAGWKVDPPTIIAAVLHDVPEDTDVDVAAVQRRFGPEVAGLVEGVTKLSAVRVPKTDIAYEVENLRHLLLAMSDDIRVVLLKLADRLHNMRTMKGIPPAKRPRQGRETLEIFAPLADRLGMGEVRSELDDLGFRYAEPKEYAWTEQQVKRTYGKRTKFIALVKHELEEVLKEEGIKATINARTKNMYSLYRKLVQKERDIDKIYDLFAIRIIVDTVEQCYQGMGVIHQHWQPLPGRIKDYIAIPKANGYRSLHTTIFGPGKRLLEVQLRTWQMHEEAELGVAAHAIYADQKRSIQASTEQLTVMRQLTSWQEELRVSPELERFKLDMFSDRLFAFTPKGALYSLAAGSTPVDFAYAVHSEIGNSCRGAKVNGVMVPLDSQLKNGDVVEVLTQKSSTPKRDWLTFVRTGQARSAIRAFFRKQARSENVAAGQSIFETYLKKHRLNKGTLTKKQTQGLLDLAPNLKELDDLYAVLGEGLVTVGQLDRALGLHRPIPVKPRKPGRPQKPVAVNIGGVSTLQTKRAKCCNPRAGQQVVGYITIGGGISVHRADCPQVKKVPDPSRLISVDWQR